MLLYTANLVNELLEVKIVIINEISMVFSDLFKKIHTRLN